MITTYKMLVCEMILIGVGCVSVLLVLGMGYAFKRIVDTFNDEIRTLTSEVMNLTEKIKKMQLKILSLNEISGLNS